MKPPFIYALIDPLEPERLRYIGMTMVDPFRPLAHLGRKKTLPVAQWAILLAGQGRSYHVVILESFPEETPVTEVFAAERRHIRKARTDGHPLTNADSGGCGGKRPSAETRAKMSASHKGKKFSAEARANMSAAKKRRPPENAELRARKSERAKRQHIEHPTPRASIEKRNAAMRGNQYAVGSKSTIGQTHTDPARTKMENAWTPERRAAQAERNREMGKRSLAERIRISEAILARDRRIFAKAQALGIT